MEDLEQQQQQVVDSVTLNSYDKKQIPRNPIFLDGTYMISRSLSSLRSISSSSSSSLTTSHLLRSVSSVPNMELVRKDSIMMTTTTTNNNEDDDEDDSFHVHSKRSSRRSFRKFFFFFLSSSSTSTSFFTTLMGLAMLTWIGAFVVELGADDSRQLRSNRIMKSGMMMNSNNNNDTFIHVDESMDEYLDSTTKNDLPKEDMTISSILQSLSNISIGYFEANHVLDMFLQVQRDTYSSMMEEDEGHKVDDDTSNNKNDNEKSKMMMLEEEGKNVTGSHVEIILVEESWQNGNTTTEVISINS